MANSSLDRAIVTDVTLREYGQNVPARFLPIFTPEIRTEIAKRLIGAGFRDIEILSCVHPAIAPAMNRDALKKTSEKLGRIVANLTLAKYVFRNYRAQR
jgi:isopropylmalate/homocitrate/citramalate synthase